VWVGGFGFTLRCVWNTSGGWLAMARRRKSSASILTLELDALSLSAFSIAGSSPASESVSPAGSAITSSFNSVNTATCQRSTPCPRGHFQPKQNALGLVSP